MFNFCPNIQYNSCPGRGGKVGEERGGWRCFRSHCLKSFSFCNCVFYGPSVYCFLKCIKINELNCCCEALKWFAAAKMSPLPPHFHFLAAPHNLYFFSAHFMTTRSRQWSPSRSRCRCRCRGERDFASFGSLLCFLFFAYFLCVLFRCCCFYNFP